VPARVRPDVGGRIAVDLREPQYAVTPGQSVVLYQGERVLGGGVIAHAA
jgi:tRNA-specific 2-thiouridylase